ncbi:AbrB family transcriptional regulator [Salipiger sp. P9]|uniref:AbrB family transcriptional regulator n=1 Tax=Salipiger pentaromativorans TaxID=2943193 RepID=UPI0021580A3A|nr:AbrB family transcriptional regulator [Salipiger pentaromativorans]MCR8549206.1 AbrB family transcriptional regulator [Salipiger pentaromativorans]
MSRLSLREWLRVSRWKAQLGTLALAGAGAWCFLWLGVPLPWLFGPMCFCLVAGLMRAPLVTNDAMTMASRLIIGVTAGTAITPDVVAHIPRMAYTVAIVPLFVATAGLVGVPYFMRVCGFDRATAYYAAMPGGLTDMVLFGREAGGDERALALVHTTRVVATVALLPVLLAYAFDLDFTPPDKAQVSPTPMTELLLMGIAGYAGWRIALRLRLFGAPVLGPLILGAALSLTGLVEHRPPAEVISAAQFFLGVALGAGYVGVTFAELGGKVLAGVVYVLILAALAGFVTEVVVQLGLLSPLEGLLAFAPGGQAEMMLLALAAGADIGIVVVHHLVRLVLIILAAPLVASRLRLGPRK